MRFYLSYFVIPLVILNSLGGCAKSKTALLDAPSSEEVQTTTSYPSVVEVVLPRGVGMCSGTFISPRAVLTAAHCALNAGTYTLFSSFGTFTATQRATFGPGILNDPNDISILILDHNAADPAQGQVAALGQSPQVGQEIRIVGFGCDDLDTKTGAGVKRTGTNQILDISDYLELDTTPTASLIASHNNAKILGPENQAGSCFGDSGGPMFQTQGNSLKVVGVTHAGGWDSDLIRSQYINLNRSDNLGFLQEIDRENDLGLFTGCWTSDEPEACGPSSASFHIFSFLQDLWTKLLSFF